MTCRLLWNVEPLPCRFVLEKETTCLDLYEVEPWPQCESCLEGKMTKRHFAVKDSRIEELLELVHTDICGPMNIEAHAGYEYYIIFIDDYS